MPANGVLSRCSPSIRPDLGDRAIFITLSPISESQRRPEHVIWREFERARPQILGALLDAAVQGLQRRGRVTLQRLPRMADFALWATACETACWPAGTFENAYWVNRRSAVESIEADPVAQWVRELMEQQITAGAHRRARSGDNGPACHQRRMAENPPRVGGPAAPGADISARAWHRNQLQP